MRIGAVLLAALLVGPPVAAETASQNEVETALTCQCGCGLTVHSCNHLNCPSAEPIKAEIQSRLAAGESKQTILDAFVTKYGEKVLSSPTMAGFNWFAWITPFAAVLIASGVLVLVMRRRVGESADAVEDEVAPASPGDTARRGRLTRELEDVDRSS